MKDIFSSHFATDEERRKNIWKECFFVFDTNVLTAVYKRSDHARDALYQIVRSLGDRLWIPYQVGYEFLDNRAKITHDQSRIYAAAIDELKAFLDSLEVATRHPFLSEKLHNEFLDVSKKVIDELEGKRAFHESRLTTDDVKHEFASLLAGKVGRKYDEAQLRQIVKEGDVRYSNQIPPGFQDINKHKGSSVFGDICKRYGDLIIWKQVIEKAKDLGKPVIMVTGEQKEDWWEKCAGKIIGPLPQLIEEFNSEVGKDFYLYSYHSFLSLANEYLEQTTSAEVIEEVREAAIDEALSSDFNNAIFDKYLPPNSEQLNLAEYPWENYYSSNDTSLATIKLANLKPYLIEAKKNKAFAQLKYLSYKDKRSPEGKSQASIYRARAVAADIRISELQRKIDELETLIISQSAGRRDKPDLNGSK